MKLTLIILRGLWNGLTNPVFIVALLGPYGLIVAIRLIRDEATTADSSQYTQTLQAFLNDSFAPGFVSYLIQYYTAIVVVAFWVFYWLQKGLYRDVITLKTIDRETIPLGIYTILGILLFVFCCHSLFFGGAAKMSLLDVYIQGNPQFGTSKVPPFNSVLTWMRILVGIHGACYQFVPARPNTIHSAT